MKLTYAFVALPVILVASLSLLRGYAPAHSGGNGCQCSLTPPIHAQSGAKIVRPILHRSLPYSQPGSLQELVKDASVIALGITGNAIDRAHNPPSGRGLAQHVVFEFRVQKLLKDVTGRAGSLLLIRQNQGDLPWTESGISGEGVRNDDESLLVPGKRYLLFLRPIDRIMGRPYKPGLIISQSGQKLADSREFLIAPTPWGIAEVTDRVLTLPTSDEIRQVPWRFQSGAQLLGMSEDSAAVSIRAMCANHSRVPEWQQKLREHYLKTRPGTMTFRPAEEAILSH